LIRVGFNQKLTIAIAVILIAAIMVPAFAFLNMQNQNAPPPDKPSATSTPKPTDTPSDAEVTPTKTQGKTQEETAAGGAKEPNPTPIPNQLGPIESSLSMDSNVWRAVGANAWNYFAPNVGVDGKTGLPCAGSSYPYFTDWDLGVYIQSIIDASKLGLIGNSGAWGFNDRIEKVLTFLETRELNNASYPYWFYQAADGGIYHNNSDVADFVVDVADTGRLLVALGNLESYNANLAGRINNLVNNTYGNRSDYAALVPALHAESLTSTNIYTYYVVYGFACFWPDDLANDTATILDNIYASGNVSVSGVMLPKAALTSDVLLSLMFETNHTAKLTALMNQVYLAHEAYYQNTGKYRAFGEGASTSSWQWEWVVLPDNRTWTVLDGSGSVSTASPVIYAKVAFGFLALYNTTFARSMSVYLEHSFYSFLNGYGDGVSESKVTLYISALHTNGLIMDAALYGATNPK
jgi:hypothetical protein